METDNVVAGKNDFVATVSRGQTTRFVLQDVGATSSFEYVVEIRLATGTRVVTPHQHKHTCTRDRVVAPKGGATSTIIHVDKTTPATGDRVVTTNGDISSSYKHVEK